MKTYLDIIEDTVEYYFHHNRAVTSKGYCSYITDEGEKCAIGRYTKNPKELEIITGSISTVIYDLMNDRVDYDIYHENLILSQIILKGEVAHLNNINFWAELQKLHDFDTNWNKKLDTGNSLSEHGQKEYIKLLETDWK